jgi:hypothetical protein
VFFSSLLEREVVVERERILRFLKGREIKAYSVTPSGKVVVMPYKLAGDRMTLLTSKEFRTQFPNTWNYLLANREYLEAREDGCMNHDSWFGFIYPKNLSLFCQIGTEL